MTANVIAYCGLDCEKCRAFKATQTDDFQLKEQIAKDWTKDMSVEFKPEDIKCNGCTSDTISGWCTKICKVRPCAEERRVKTCAHCGDYPCEKLTAFLTKEPEATKNLEEIRKTSRS